MRTDFLSKAHSLIPAPPVDGAAGPVSPSLLVMVAGVTRAARGAVARFHYPSIRACRRMMSSAIVDACCVEGGASQSISGPQDHGRGRERRPLDLLPRHPSPVLPKSGRGRHQLLSPRRWRSIEKRLVVDLISEHHVESDQELTR